VKQGKYNLHQARTFPTRATTASKIKENDNPIADSLLAITDLLAHIERVCLETLFLIAKNAQTNTLENRCNTASKNLYV
jgi:hypothetical protein